MSESACALSADDMQRAYGSVRAQLNDEQKLIADATVADAILDRLIHNAYRFELKGESLRKRPDQKPPSD